MPTTPKEFNVHAIFKICPQPCANDLQTLVLNPFMHAHHIDLKSTAWGLNLSPATWFHKPYACIQKCQGLKKAVCIRHFKDDLFLFRYSFHIVFSNVS